MTTTIASDRPVNPPQPPERAARARAEGGAGTAAAPAELRDGEILSPEEKQFFARLYPEETKTISTHSTYSRSGLARAGAVGSLIDKKS